jgi:NAD-dependent DNA ligase
MSSFVFDSDDLKARKLLMSSYLYYQHDTSVLSDGEYDALSKEVADLVAAGGGEIHKDRLAQLGSADEIRASGVHMIYTDMAANAAASWLEHETGRSL